MTAQHQKLYAVQPDHAHGWWVVSTDEDGEETIDESNDGGFNQETARRLVACWNACDGLSTSFLEDAAELRAEPLRDLVKETEAERDELLAALQTTTAWMERLRGSGDAGNWGWSQGDEYSQGIAAIQKATNKEQAAAIGAHKEGD